MLYFLVMSYWLVNNVGKVVGKYKFIALNAYKKIDIDIALILIHCLPFPVVGGCFKFKMNKDAE